VEWGVFVVECFDVIPRLVFFTPNRRATYGVVGNTKKTAFPNTLCSVTWRGGAAAPGPRRRALGEPVLVPAPQEPADHGPSATTPPRHATLHAAARTPVRLQVPVGSRGGGHYLPKMSPSGVDCTLSRKCTPTHYRAVSDSSLQCLTPITPGGGNALPRKSPINVIACDEQTAGWKPACEWPQSIQIFTSQTDGNSSPDLNPLMKGV